MPKVQQRITELTEFRLINLRAPNSLKGILNELQNEGRDANSKKKNSFTRSRKLREIKLRKTQKPRKKRVEEMRLTGRRSTVLPLLSDPSLATRYPRRCLELIETALSARSHIAQND